jgi:hypothetical protein
MRQLFCGIMVLSALLITGGCGPNLSSREFGTIAEGVPQVPGADKPFEMPELGPPPPEDVHSHSHHF